jgi:acyl-CoA thioesterase-1
MKRILILGDSLSAAFGIPKEQGWVALLEQRIAADRLPYRIQNASITGDTTAGGLSRLNALLSEPVDVFVAELGANDALRGVEPTATRQNLDAILRQVRKSSADAKLVVVGMSIPANLGPGYSAALAKISTEVAHQHGAALVPDLLLGIAGEILYTLEDGLHPNEKGQIRIFQTIWPILEPLLRTDGK